MTSFTEAKQPPRPPKEVTPEEVTRAIRGVKFGSVLVKIHDGKIQEYEVTEKRRPN